MAILVLSVINAAYGKSAAARPDAQMSNATLIAQIGLALYQWFELMGRENPYILGAQQSVAYNGAGWPYPSNCLKWIQVQATAGTIATPAIAAGTPLNVVPWDDQGFANGLPSLTELGQQFVATGQTVDPSGGTLNVVYSRTPVQPAQTTDTIDALFPDHLQDYLNFDLAAFMAVTDQRKEDEQTFLAMKGAMISASTTWAEEVSFGVTARFPLVTPPLTNRAGGAQRGAV